MRLKFNKEAEGILNASEILLKQRPIYFDQTTYVEIGMGKGQMISQMALENPHINFIGWEKYSTIALYALKKIQKNNISNLKLIVDDATNIEEILASKVDKIYLTFSDPWPKKRHAKRRLLHRNFLTKFSHVLKPDGIIIFKTDNDFLYNFALEELEFLNANIIFQTTDLHNSIKNHTNIPTEYELKWSAKGKNINYVEFNFVK
ncbi:tRNA (guanosine(46)-N7)-methyltransferase TrmB [Mycoplasma miroungirhinis]|uniref:tRNA (guanine-N(7)-)-methyltransferase n=1 Tax=Mycoplasma miroungirhinis TaxID=754516 RepID=A0A6M4JA94_9MOLU|nr:tRNA (guanosine(46)-N7)-methyltransferase TrmB [Mycoplasma miroungirhinis]QJR43873.1 tRNA (guanosine(46)-N7)-methyltransferase TrmB [Mycoplasma miroungirhinis]